MYKEFRDIDMAPLPEELGARVVGLSFDEFRVLPDEDLKELHERISAKFEALQPFKTSALNNPKLKQEYYQSIDDLSWFNKFSYWRRQGVPDRDVTHDELVELVVDSIRGKIESTPGFGFIDPIKHSQLSGRTQAVVNRLISYLLDDKEIFDYPIVDAGVRLGLGLRKDDLETLQRGGVIEHIGHSAIVGDNYILTGDYRDAWLLEALEITSKF